VGATDLDNVFPFLSLRCDPVVQRLYRWNQPSFYIDRCRDIHGVGKRVVGRLGHVDVVVGMNRCLAGERCTSQLATAVGDHFVDVHVELRAAAGHPHMQREHVVMLTGQYFVADRNDQLVALVIEPLTHVVRIGGGL
jgi:hypothetical protein